MAVYMPAGRRRRRTVIVVAVAVAVALAAGFLLGRGTSRGIDDAVADAKDKAAVAVSALARLPIEYEQKVGGTGGETEQTMVESVDAASARLVDAFDAAPWLTRTQKNAATDAIAAVRADVQRGVSREEFRTDIADASKAVASTFGLPARADIG